jgi:gliding motility-associated-like protein
VASSDLTGCSDTLILKDKIFSYPMPTALFEASPAMVLISNPLIQFNNLSEQADNYLWDFGDQSMYSELENPTHTYREMDFFDVKLIAGNEFGCIDSVAQQVSVAFDKLFPPTAFSPHDALAENREFRIHAMGILDEGYRLFIFNRWGEVIFISTNPELGWNGKMKNGSYAPAGVYTYVVEYFDFRKERFSQQGTVTLLF